MRLESLMSKARAAGYAMGDPEERSVENASADQRWATSPDPLIVQRFATIAAKRAAKKFALVRSKAAAFRSRNLPVPVGIARRVRAKRALPYLMSWWRGGAAA